MNHYEPICDEESPLLTKFESSSVATYSQRTIATVSISGSDEFQHEVTEQAALEADFLGSTLLIPKDEGHEIDEEPASIQEYLLENRKENVLRTVLEELQHEENEGEAHFIEMGLTRNVSILPSDVMDVAAKNNPIPLPTEDYDLEVGADPIKMESIVREKIPVFAYFLLLGAVVSLASIGPLLQVQEGATPTMKVVWRMAGTSFLLIPGAAVDVSRKGFPVMTASEWSTFFLSTVSYCIMTVSFVLALDYTAVGNVVILSNSLALIMLVGKLCIGDPITHLEGLGALVAFSGAVLCSKDSAESRSESNGLMGDALAILSALGGVGYLIFAKSSRQHMPMSFFMFLTMTIGTGFILLFEITFLNELVTLDMNQGHGFWGFLSPEPDRLPLELVIVVVCNLCGTMGYVRAMQYFDNLVISSAALLEPVIAEFMSFGLGMGQLPGFQGWLGNFLVAAGTFAVLCKDVSAKGRETDMSLH